MANQENNMILTIETIMPYLLDTTKLSEMTVKKLVSFCRDYNIRPYSGKRKQELVDFIQNRLEKIYDKLNEIEEANEAIKRKKQQEEQHKRIILFEEEKKNKKRVREEEQLLLDYDSPERKFTFNDYQDLSSEDKLDILLTNYNFKKFNIFRKNNKWIVIRL